ncbi:hypothetical protein D3C85_711490 [compost metagenome]
MGGQALGHVDEGGQRLGGVEEVLQVGVRRVEHHADEGDGLQRRAQARHVRAEVADVVGRGEDRTADIDAAADVRVVVRVERRHELDLGLALEELHHLRGMVEEGVDRRGIEEGTGFVLQVGACCLAAVLHAVGPGVAVAGDPQHAAGKGRGAAEMFFLLDHHDIEAVLLRHDGGGESAGAGADDQHVAGEGGARVLQGHEQSPGRKPGTGAPTRRRANQRGPGSVTGGRWLAIRSRGAESAPSTCLPGHRRR